MVIKDIVEDGREVLRLAGIISMSSCKAQEKNIIATITDIHHYLDWIETGKFEESKNDLFGPELIPANPDLAPPNFPIVPEPAPTLPDFRIDRPRFFPDLPPPTPPSAASIPMTKVNTSNTSGHTHHAVVAPPVTTVPSCIAWRSVGWSTVTAATTAITRVNIFRLRIRIVSSFMFEFLKP